MQHIKEKIRKIPDFPKKGILFYDITTLLQDSQGFSGTIRAFVERYKGMDIDVVAGIESRGFIFAGAIAFELGKGFVPIRKKGKLPYKTESMAYDLEYGSDAIEIHVDAIKPGDKVLLVDDLMAKGATARAACTLIEKLGGRVVECAFLIELPELNGKQKLENRQTFSLIEFKGN